VEAPGVESGVGRRSFDTSRAVSDANARDPKERFIGEGRAADVSRSVEASHCSIEVRRLRQVLSDLDGGQIEAARTGLAAILELAGYHAALLRRDSDGSPRGGDEVT
jgi:hypothetical protein